MTTIRVPAVFIVVGILIGATGALSATTLAGRASNGADRSSPVARAGTAVPAAAPASGGDQASAAPMPVAYVGKVDLTPSKGVAGTTAVIAGSGFEPGARLDLTWNTVSGSWVLEGTANEEFHGRAFEPVERPLGSATVDATGRFSASFTAPDDFGFYHDVTVEQSGRLVNKAAFRLEPEVSISPRSGPVGTPITVTMNGVGWANLENSWHVTYDNRFTGLLSSVTTGGRAVATIAATGEPGEHILRIVHGSFTVPYLNMEQSPRPDRPTFTFRFRVTDGAPVLPPDVTDQGLVPEQRSEPSGTGPAIWTDVASGPVGTAVNLRGRGFAPGAAVGFTWATVVGNRVGGDGWEESVGDFGTATAGADGRVALATAIPDDLGGAHRIAALVKGSSVAETALTITPSIISVTPIRGAAGTQIDIELKGVGWTETANIYTLVYDNGYLGYVCGFNSQGDVKIHLPAAGAAGWHVIDLYPGIYKGKDAPGVQNFRIPQLTVEDHPGERLPTFRIMFEITEGS